MIPEYEFDSGDLARMFGVSQVSIRKWAEAGYLTGIKTLGPKRGQLRFSSDDVEALRRRLALQPAKEPQADSAEPV